MPATRDRRDLRALRERAANPGSPARSDRPVLWERKGLSVQSALPDLRDRKGSPAPSARSDLQAPSVQSAPSASPALLDLPVP